MEILIYWKNGLIIRNADGNTGSFETDNGLELDDENYLEYYACVVRIAEVIQEPNETINPHFGEIKAGGYIEVSELNEPIKIETLDGTSLWQKKK